MPLERCLFTPAGLSCFGKYIAECRVLGRGNRSEFSLLNPLKNLFGEFSSDSCSFLYFSMSASFSCGVFSIGLWNICLCRDGGVAIALYFTQASSDSILDWRCSWARFCSLSLVGSFFSSFSVALEGKNLAKSQSFSRTASSTSDCLLSVAAISFCRFLK